MSFCFQTELMVVTSPFKPDAPTPSTFIIFSKSKSTMLHQLITATKFTTFENVCYKDCAI